MTATTSHAPDGGGPPPAEPATAPRSVENLCLQLGWTMQRLYRATPVRPKSPEALPARLPGLSALNRLERVEIDLGTAQASLEAITVALSWASAPDISAIVKSLRAFQPINGSTHLEATGDAVRAYREAVLGGHVLLLKAITAERPNYGKAYNLGRALADTCRPIQNATDLQNSFEPYRLKQLEQDLNDLASALPDHAAKSVARSLTWWRDMMYVTDRSKVGNERRELLANVRTDAPPLRSRKRRSQHPKLRSAKSETDLTTLAAALPRQGELWRVILTGGKKPTDLLTTGDYVKAARHAVADLRAFARRALVAAPWTITVLMLVLSAALFGVLAVIHYSDVTSGSKLAAFLVAIGGYLGAVWRAIAPRLKASAKALEKPLWESAVDYVSAEAISTPPVGLPDSAGWASLNGSADKEPPTNGSVARGADRPTSASGREAEEDGRHAAAPRPAY